jgi:nitrite reductase/ring-hydroxylating ferredoxin subunit
VRDFQTAARLDDLTEGQLTAAQVSVEGTSVPLVLLKRGSEVFALGNVCTHAGGPLTEGTLVDDTVVQCPWHGSRFDMRAGRIVRGPATMAQPAYETRVRDGDVDVRRRREDDA